MLCSLKLRFDENHQVGIWSHQGWQVAYHGEQADEGQVQCDQVHMGAPREVSQPHVAQICAFHYRHPAVCAYPLCHLQHVAHGLMGGGGVAAFTYISNTKLVVYVPGLFAKHSSRHSGQGRVCPVV